MKNTVNYSSYMLLYSRLFDIKFFISRPTQAVCARTHTNINTHARARIRNNCRIYLYNIVNHFT